MQESREPRRVLIVDDSSTSRKITIRCFQTAVSGPIEFVEAFDGANALSLLDSGNYDLVITDLNMPRMDGMTFVWKVKMAGRKSAGEIIVLSSMDNAQIRAALYGLGVKHYLQKPVTPAKIAECVGW